MQSSPDKLITSLSALMSRYPAYASYVKTARDAVLGAISADGVHGMILRALESGAATYDDLRRETGFSKSHLHRHLSKLIRDGRVFARFESRPNQNRPRKLFFPTKNKAPAAKK